MAPSPDLDVPNKRKRKVNPKLLDDDNVSSDAVKRRKVEALKSTTRAQISTSATAQSSSRPQSSQPTAQSIPSTSRQASVEAVHDEGDITCYNAGTPRNSSTILESVDDNDDDIYEAQHATDAQQVKEKETEELAETDDDELGKTSFRTLLTTEYIFMHCF